MFAQLRSRAAGLTADLPPTYWFLWLGTLVNRLGGFVIPFLTLYLHDARGLSVGQAAALVALFGAGSFSAALVGGELADRLGRRPTMLLSFFGAPLAMLGLGFAQAVPLIGVCTLAVGFFTDLYRPAMSAALTDLVPPHARTRAFGYIYWAINVGAGVAPMLAGLMARQNYLLLFIADAATTLVFGLIVLARVPETRPAEVHHAANVSLGERARQARREPRLLAFTALGLLFGTIYMQGMVTLPVQMRASGLTPADYGVAASLNGLLIVLIGIQASNAASRWPPFTVLAGSAILLGAGFGLTGLAHTLPWYGLSVIVWTLGEVAAASVAPTVIANLSPVELRGLYQGIFSAAWGLSFLTGPLIGGWVYEQVGPAALWGGCFVAGLVLALGYGWLGRSGEPRLPAPAGSHH